MTTHLIHTTIAHLQATPNLPPIPRCWSEQPIASVVDTTDPATIARLLDHTLLKPQATPAQIEHLCQCGLRYRFAAVCVNPCYVRLCVALLRESDIAVCTVIGFPIGATTTNAKVSEAQEAIQQGAQELDMVLPIGLLKASQYAAVLADIAAVVKLCHNAGAKCKVIIETALLTDEEKVTACLLAATAGADFVKTSTGFAGGGATTADVALMRQTIGATAMGVKASGGIRTLAEVQAMVAAGATRIGSSSGVAIVGEQHTTPHPQP